MSDLVRISISLEADLARRLAALIRGSRYANRSQFVRDLIRRQIVDRQWAGRRRPAVGTITLVYDHHARELLDRLIDVQHRHAAQILASTHVHLSGKLCAEMIMVHARPDRIRKLADELRQLRGVLHTTLGMAGASGVRH